MSLTTMRLLFLGVVPAASEGLTFDLDGVSHTHSEKSLYAVNPDGSTKWIFDSEGYLVQHAEGLNNTVYASTDSTLFSLNGADGSIMWWQDVHPGQVSGLSVAKDGTAYVTSHVISGLMCNTTVHAITPTGAEKWSFTCAGCSALSDIGPDGTLFLGAAPGYLQPEHDWFALQPDTGAVKWSVVRDPALSYSSELSISGPHVFLLVQGYNESVLSGLNYEDGKSLWSYPISLCHYTSTGHTPMPEVVPNHMMMGHNELYVSGIAHPLVPCSYGIFAFNGTNLRNLPCAYESHLEALSCDSSAYSRDEDIFVSYSDTSVLAFSGTDGSITWSVSEPHLAAPSEPRFSFGQDGTTFVSQFDEASADWRASSQTSAIRNGEMIWKVQTGGVLEPLMLQDGTTYVDGWHCQENSCELELVAIGVDGDQKWRFRPTNGSVEEKAEAIEIAV